MQQIMSLIATYLYSIDDDDVDSSLPTSLTLEVQNETNIYYKWNNLFNDNK